MSLSNLIVKQGYLGNGSQVAFPITFAFTANAQVKVYKRDETDPLNPVVSLFTEGALQDYTLTGANPPSQPLPTTVTFNAGKAPSASVRVFIVRDLPLTQESNFGANSNLSLLTLEQQLDKIVMQIQQLDERSYRSSRLSVTSTATAPHLADPVANNILIFDPTGTKIISGGDASTIGTAAANAALAVQAKNDALQAKADAVAAQLATAALLGAANDFVPAITGSSGTPVGLVAASGIAFTGTKWHNTWYIKGNVAAITLTTNTITAATNVGQRLRLISKSATMSVTIGGSATRMDLNGDWVGGLNSVLELEWDGTTWVEIARR